MLGNTEVTRFHVKIPGSIFRLMVTKATGLLIAEEAIQDGLHRLTDTRHGLTWATMGDQSAHVLQEEGSRLFDPNNFLYVEKECATGIGKTLLMARLAKRLAWEASAEDVKSWDPCLGIYLGDVSLEVFVIVQKQGPVCPMIEVAPVGLTGGRIPLARKDTPGAIGVIESDMESSDSSEKIDELVGALLGHTPPKHILGQL